MAVLVIAEHDNRSLKVATLNAVTAAAAFGVSVDVLVAGHQAAAVAQAAAADRADHGGITDQSDNSEGDT